MSKCYDVDTAAERAVELVRRIAALPTDDDDPAWTLSDLIFDASRIVDDLPCTTQDVPQ